MECTEDILKRGKCRRRGTLVRLFAKESCDGLRVLGRFVVSREVADLAGTPILKTMIVVTITD